MLFSEPKIPQWLQQPLWRLVLASFQCSSASRKFLNGACAAGCSCTTLCFSALQRAENSSIIRASGPARAVGRFSALQRAENSSIRLASNRRSERLNVSVLFSEPKIPQCVNIQTRQRQIEGFIALQRAENSSIFAPAARRSDSADVSVLFSEPKIPQSLYHSVSSPVFRVSVLFSEPKIPQFVPVNVVRDCGNSFSALQRAENSSMESAALASLWRGGVSVLFSEPKIPQLMNHPCQGGNAVISFSALQRAENSSIMSAAPVSLFKYTVSVLFSEPKIPQSQCARAIGATCGGFSALQRAENSSICSSF